MAFALTSVGCGHAPAQAPPPCPGPESLEFSVTGSSRLNTDDAGQSLSTVVRLYLLKTPQKLEAATVEAISQNDRDVLSDDLVASTELTLSPSERTQRKVERQPGATWAAAVGLFRRPAGSSWRAVRRLPNPDPDHCRRGGRIPRLTVLVEESRVELR